LLVKIQIFSTKSQIRTNIFHKSQIYPEKLVFDENSYRTSRVNEAFLLLTKTINELQGQKKENATVSDGVFKDAPEDQEVSNRFRDDLLIFNELINLYSLQFIA
jgi:hypothetical protein